MPFLRRSSGSARDPLVEADEERVVEALAGVAEPGGDGGRAGRRSTALGTRAQTLLAAGLVVEPEHGQAGGLQQVEQVLVLGAALLERGLAERREHARHRVARVGAARADVAEAEHAGRGQLGVGVARVAVEREVIGARRLADDERPGAAALPARVARARARRRR